MSEALDTGGQKAASGELAISADQIRAQVRRISESEEFEKSARLKDFLYYIVEESLNGRSAYLKGLTIGQALFATDDGFDPEANSIVRVEAGRLRRRLNQYYSSVGMHDPIVVEVPKGTYAPVFTQKHGSNSLESPALARWNWAVASGIGIIGIVGLAWYLSSILDSATGPADNGSFNTWQGQESEAEILFRQALVLLMPPENRARLSTSIELFQNVIDSEPNFAGGYAGKSLAYSIGVLFIKSRSTENDLLQAVALAERAIELETDFSLGYAALAMAQSLGSKHVLAQESARRSIASANRDALADAMVSLALIISDMPFEAIELLPESLELVTDNPRTPHLNILGIAYFVTGNYEEAARNFEKNLVQKGPSGPHMDIFRAATYARLGKGFRAQGISEKLQQSFPDYPTELWLGNFIKSEDDLQDTMHLLRDSGFSNL